jgi:3-hydroxyisobutyrate dehydrogenase-like beta-hydroxyacid dehydrogenase
MAKPKIGFIGLGTMGLPMASNLLKAGYELAVYNRTPAKAGPLLEKGAQLAESPADAARRSEITITMLTANQAVEEAILGENGVIRGAAPGSVLIDCSTISPKTSKMAASRLAEIGIDHLDAPVTGSEPHAYEGSLTFMVGGKKSVYERCLPLFQAMGKRYFHVGESGAGSYAKLANNTIGAINLLSLSEGLAMAAKAGIDPRQFLEIISGGGARSGMADNKAHKILERDFHPHFKTALMHKDLGLALEMANEINLPVPVLSTVREMLFIAMSKGLASEDMCSVIKIYEEWAGIEVKDSAS